MVTYEPGEVRSQTDFFWTSRCGKRLVKEVKVNGGEDCAPHYKQLACDTLLKIYIRSVYVPRRAWKLKESNTKNGFREFIINSNVDEKNYKSSGKFCCTSIFEAVSVDNHRQCKMKVQYVFSTKWRLYKNWLMNLISVREFNICKRRKSNVNVAKYSDGFWEETVM